MKKRIHALAEIFPALSETAFSKLKDSIDEHGQRDAIVLLGDAVLDGRNRYRACLELGRNPIFRNFDPARDGSPVKFVADKNLNRRHLTPGQRASVAKKIDEAMNAEAKELAEAAKNSKPDPNEDKTGATVEPGGDAKPQRPEPRGPLGDNGPDKPAADAPKDDRPFRKQEKEAADAAGASPRSLRDFKFVEKYSKKDAALVSAGTITLNEGVKRAKAKKEKGSKFRNEAADLIEDNMGSDFAEKIRSGEILTTDAAIRNFSRLELKDQKRVETLVLEGMPAAAALKFKNGDFEETDTIATLISWFKGHDEKDLDEGGWVSIEIDGHVVAIGKAAKTDAEEV